MKRPHEETLVVWDKQQAVRIMRETGAGDPLKQYTLAMVYEPGPHDDPTIKSYDDGRRVAVERASLLAAAPEMARLLLDFLSNYEIGEKADAKMRQVLTKAGVPLP